MAARPPSCARFRSYRSINAPSQQSMSTRSPEAQLILDSLHAFVQGETWSHWPDTLDWKRLIRLGYDQRFIPILHATLDKSVLPDEVQNQLAHAARQQRIRTALLVEAFGAISQGFMQAGIPVMPVKGMFLAHRVYQSVNHRYFDDIDLLVPVAAARDAVAVMHKLGYTVHPRAQKPDWHHLAPFWHEKSKVVVELHTDVIRRAQPGWDVAEIWQRAERGRIAGVETYLISEPDALVHTALHARHSLYKRISYFLDAHLQLRHLSPADVVTTASLLRVAGAEVALAYLHEAGTKGLGFAAAAPIPSASRWRLRLTDRLAPWDTLDRRQETQVEGPMPNLLELLLMDSWPRALRMGYRLIFPPAHFLTEFYGADQKVNYGKRILSRTRRFAQQLFTKKANDKVTR